MNPVDTNIIKIEKRYGYTTIINNPINDMELAWDTLGLFVYLMSKPPGWKINVDHLASLKRGGAGRKAILRMLRNLEDAGYFYRKRERGPDGRFVWVRAVFEAKEENPLFNDLTRLLQEPSPQSPEGTMEVQAQNAAELPQSPEGIMEVRTKNAAESPQSTEGIMEVQSKNAAESPQSPQPPVAEGTILVNTDQVNINNTLGKNIQQQQDRINDRTRAREAIAAAVAENTTSGEILSGNENPPEEEGFTVWDAFRVASVKNPTAKRIPAAWRRATGRDLTPEDVLAWHFQREAENIGRTPERRLGVAVIIHFLEAGEPADEQFYERAREFLTELTADEEEGEEVEAEPLSPELPRLHRALEAFLPSLNDVGVEALDAMRAGLLEITRDIHARGVTPEDLADLRLYLLYTGQPMPRPDEIADVLAQTQAEPEFQAWRERKAEAEKLWQHISSARLAAPGSVIDQALRRAAPVDLNGALTILADSNLEFYFRRVWERQGPVILSQTEYPETLPIHFITSQ